MITAEFPFGLWADPRLHNQGVPECIGAVNVRCTLLLTSLVRAPSGMLRPHAFTSGFAAAARLVARLASISSGGSGCGEWYTVTYVLCIIMAAPKVAIIAVLHLWWGSMM